MCSIVRTAALGALAALGFGMGAARAADLDEIAGFALNICDAVNATGITISSADHCMKFSGEFTWEKFILLGSLFDEFNGSTELSLTTEVLGDSDFGVTRGWLELVFHLNGGQPVANGVAIEEIGISIGNTTVLATGSGASIFNADDDELLIHAIGNATTWELNGALHDSGGVYVSVTHDLGNGWSVAKAIECIDSCTNDLTNPYDGGPLLVGVVSYDKDGITGHLSVISYLNPFVVGTVHAGLQIERDRFAAQGAFRWDVINGWHANFSAKAILDQFEFAGGLYFTDTNFWQAVFSVQFDAGDFTITKAVAIDEFGFQNYRAEVAVDLSETLTLSADFSTTVTSSWEVGKELTWKPGGGYEASTRVSYDYNEEFVIESEVTLEF